MNNVDKKSDKEINNKDIETLIFIASDHAGYDLKEQIINFLESQNNQNLFDNHSLNNNKSNDKNNINENNIVGNNINENFSLQKKYTIKNLGCDSTDSVDYPNYAIKVAKLVQKNISNSKGILICGTGSGMAITANKFKCIRAVNCFTTEMAEMAIKHNNANILCLGARILETKNALNIIRTFLNTDFEGGRHQKRIDKISAIELQ